MNRQMSEKAVSDDLEALNFENFLARRQTMVAPRELRTHPLEHTLKTGVLNNTPRCVLVHTKVCTIAHQGV